MKKMEEKVLNRKPNGMPMLILLALVYIAAIAGAIACLVSFDQSNNPEGYVAGAIICVIYLMIGWILFGGFKILKPQEAIVLTLFGKYYGTIKGEGFYWVNPFCQSFNPAAKTKLGQSSDVTTEKTPSAASQAGANAKISLKIMTLSNAKQKINDCLGNPIEIGIAVT